MGCVSGVEKIFGYAGARRDIFVEMDFMVRGSATRGLGPSSAVIAAIQKEFASAPMSNPDGSTGISLHLQLGNEVPHDSDLDPYIDEFQSLKNANFDRRRLPIFHYMIWADGYTIRFGGQIIKTSSGVSMDIPPFRFSRYPRNLGRRCRRH